MQNASFSFEYLTVKFARAHHQFLVFQIASEVSIKGISLRFAEFITSLSILKGTIGINCNANVNLKCKNAVLLSVCELEIQFEHTTNAQFFRRFQR